MADFDFSEVMTLAADLGDASVKVVPFARKAVEVTARNVKKDWKPGATGAGILRAYAASVDYEMILNVTGSIRAEVGPNLGRPGGVMLAQVVPPSRVMCTSPSSLPAHITPFSSRDGASAKMVA